MVNLMEESNEILGENGCEMLEEKALDTHFSDRPVDLVENIPKSWTRFDYDKFHLEKIASGFFGTVYKVRDRDTNQIMVMKCNNLTVEDGLLNEIQLMSQLCHPNILRFLGVCYDKNNIHLLTEYINGGTLEQLLLEDHSIELWWTVRLKLSHDIAQGMEYLHSQGVIHRDLASKNCLIRKGEHGDLTSVVADFGLSAHLPKNHSEEKLTVVGSPYGMAPEMLRGETYNELADVFSYGILLCEIIGRVPANPDELPRTSTFGLDIDKFQEMVGDCPAEFLAIAVVCCQINAQDRPSFISIVKLLDVLQDNYGSDSLSPREIETYDYLHSFYCRHKLLDGSPSDTKDPISCKLCNLSIDKSLHQDNYEKHEVVPCSAPEKPKQNFDSIGSDSNTTPRQPKHNQSRRRSSSFLFLIRDKYMTHRRTEQLVESTPSRLAGFFHRVLKIQTSKKHNILINRKNAPEKVHVKDEKFKSLNLTTRMSLSEQSESNCDQDSSKLCLPVSKSCPSSPNWSSHPKGVSEEPDTELESVNDETDSESSTSCKSCSTKKVHFQNSNSLNSLHDLVSNDDESLYGDYDTCNGHHKELGKHKRSKTFSVQPEDENGSNFRRPRRFNSLGHLTGLPKSGCYNICEELDCKEKDKDKKGKSGPFSFLQRLKTKKHSQ